MQIEQTTMNRRENTETDPIIEVSKQKFNNYLCTKNEFQICIYLALT